MLAVRSKAAHCTLHLIRHGANYNHVNHDGFNVLFYALEHLNLIFFDFLLRCGCDIHQRNQYGNTLLMHAIINDHLDAVSELIHRGIDVELKNLEGLTAFEIAERYHQIQCLHLLATRCRDNTENEDEPIHRHGV